MICTASPHSCLIGVCVLVAVVSFFIPVVVYHQKINSPPPQKVRLPFINGCAPYLRQIHDKVVGVGLLGCSDDVIHSGVFPSIANVLCDGGGEQDRLLFNNANQGPQPLDIKGTEIMPIQSNLYNQR